MVLSKAFKSGLGIRDVGGGVRIEDGDAIRDAASPNTPHGRDAPSRTEFDTASIKWLKYS